jgi:Mn-dependent DtxR family transcriptional regulator
MNFQYEENGDGFLVTVAYSEQKIAIRSANEGINEGLNEGISEGINILMEQIKKVPAQRVPDLSKTLGVSAKTIERWISELRKKGLIEYRGSKKTGGYWAF